MRSGSGGGRDDNVQTRSLGAREIFDCLYCAESKKFRKPGRMGLLIYFGGGAIFEELANVCEGGILGLG